MKCLNYVLLFAGQVIFLNKFNKFISSLQRKIVVIDKRNVKLRNILKYSLRDMNFSSSYFRSLFVFFAIAELRCLLRATRMSLRNLACLLTVRYSIHQRDGWYGTWVLPRVYIRLSVIQAPCNNCFTTRNICEDFSTLFSKTYV